MGPTDLKILLLTSNPMPFGEHRPKCVRTCSQMRSCLLPDAFVSAPTFANK